MQERRKREDTPIGSPALLALAALITGLGAVLAYTVSGGPPLIGIDDAAITRNYAENIANGHGFVYYIGGERVEGATSFLWTLMAALAYVVTPHPEVLIIAICGALTLVAVFAVLSLTTLLARRAGLSQQIAAGLTALGLLGLPGYFFWTVFTMMEVALWSAVLLVLVWRLARMVERPKRWAPSIVIASALLPLIRPEGVAVAVGLLALSVVLMRRLPSGIIAALAAAAASTAALVGFRLVYFGFPVPNTFYAKVSSDRLQDLIDGGKYVYSFVSEFPFAEALLTFWAIAAIWAIGRHFAARAPASGGLLVAGAAILGTFSLYTALGGDHFAYWRFLEPSAPLLVVAPALMLTALWRLIPAGGALRLHQVAVLVAGLFWFAVSYGDFRQERFHLIKEFTLVEQGLAFGELMNEIEPSPVLGVGPAGGISLSYNGPIKDLLGLNWVEMAHANPVKVGLRNHASFDKATFWKHEPDLIAEFNRRCAPDRFTVNRANENMTKGMYLEPRFQEAYAPVKFWDGDACWRGFARRGWADSVTDDRLEILDWSAVTLRISAAEPTKVSENLRFAEHRGGAEKRD